MLDWEFYKYALVASVLSIILIAISNPQYVWPWAIVVFGMQIIGVFVSHWLVRIVETKYTESRYLAPAFVLYRRYFAFTLTVYLIMGIFGYIENTFAQVYFSLFIVGLIGIGLSLLMRIMVSGSLLDDYKDEEDKE